MSELAAQERGADLRRAAAPRHAPDDGAVPVIELRLASPADADAVRRLALLDEQPELEGAVLLGVRRRPLPSPRSRSTTAASVADPFVLTDQLVALLRLRPRT